MRRLDLLAKATSLVIGGGLLAAAILVRSRFPVGTRAWTQWLQGALTADWPLYVRTRRVGPSNAALDVGAPNCPSVDVGVNSHSPGLQDTCCVC